MVRLVFRPYTQLRRSICTSESLRSSIRVSPDFNLARHSSPSFGSQRVCSCYSARSEVDAKCRDCAPKEDHPKFAFTTPMSLDNSMTRTHVRLLGPCFKTGRRHRRPTRNREATRVRVDTRYTRLLKYPPNPEPENERLSRTNQTKLHSRPRSRNSGSLREGGEKCSQQTNRREPRAIAGPKNPS